MEGAIILIHNVALTRATYKRCGQREPPVGSSHDRGEFETSVNRSSAKPRPLFVSENTSSNPHRTHSRPQPNASVERRTAQRIGRGNRLLDRTLSNVQFAFTHPFDDRGVSVGEEAAGTGIQSGDFGYVVRIELEIEDGQIFRHSLLINGLC